MSGACTDPLAAVDPRHSAWVSANAGAGKTHTLANRVTRLLLDGASPERILCLTYTKAAATEMQARLFQRLGAWSMYADDDLAKAMREIGASVPDADGLKRARRLFAMALETPGGLKIQTIHSFCQYLLARFPLEANVPPGFQVLDDQSTGDLIAEARARVLERAGAGEKSLAEAAACLVTETSEFRLQQILSAVLGNDRPKLKRFFAGLPEGGDALQRAAARAHGAEHGATAAQIAEAFCKEARAAAERLRAVIDWLDSGGKEDRKLAAGLKEFVARDFGASSFQALRGVFLTEKGLLRKRLASSERAASSSSLFEFLTDLANRYVAAEQRCRAARAAQLAEAALTLADAVQREYAKMKHARGALDYDDLVSETLNLLNRSNSAAWVLYKLDGGLDHILIDEAQDTSPEQWEIVRKLTEEFFAGKGSRDLFDLTRTIFAVGDEKQSIFSFQGADPDAFTSNRTYFHGRAGAPFADVRMITSRRSAPEILAFVDAVFATPEARNGLGSSDEPLRHKAFRVEKGQVEFWPAIKAPKTPEPDPWRPVDTESEISPVVQLAQIIAAHIRTWIDNKVCLPGHDEPIRPGDIMILMPRREPFASEIIRHLIERDVPVAGADRIRLKNEIAVMDLMALAQFVLLPEDDLNLAALLRSPLINISEDELLSLAPLRKGTLWRELSKRREELPALSFAYDLLSEMLECADFSPPYEFFAHALSAKGLRARLLARLGAEGADAIDEFLSLALAYEATATPSLQGFLHWIGRGDAEVKRDMERGRDEVRVMTVHGAKGLEADIVILPDTTALPDPPGRRGELLYDGDGVIFPIRNEDACPAILCAKEAAKQRALKEHRRLLYVALTRAKQRLCICGFEAKRGVRDGSWYTLAECAAKKIGRRLERGNGHIYAIGEHSVTAASDPKQSERVRLELPAWARTPAPTEREKPRLIRPSDELAPGEPAISSPARPHAAARFRRGLMVHALLARLPEIQSGERLLIARKFLAAQGLSPEEATKLAAETMTVLGHPDFAPAFAPGSRAEVAIVADLPEFGKGARISGRIDRLAVTDQEVLAVDFKTNRPPPMRIEDVSAIYLRQMALYRAGLARIFPGRRIACALVWTDGPCLMRLTEASLDKEIAAFSALP